jgi:hypothetical protein
MSEKLHIPEQEPSPELSKVEVKEVNTGGLDTEKTEVLDVDEARAAIHEAEPISKETTKKQVEIDTPDSSEDVRWWSKELGSLTFDRTLSSVRRKLSAPEKQLSKFIHKPVIEKVSDFGGKTIARPSGILLGGIFSFVGSLSVYLLARHIGGELRYSVFAATFVLGYLLGLIVELIWRLIARKKTS